MNNAIIRGKHIKYTGKDEFWKLWEANALEPESFDVLDKYIRKKATFIDIGAWCGVLSLYAQKLGAKVYSCEPDPIAFAALDANDSLNGEKLNLVPVAISDKNGKVLLNTQSGFGNSESSLNIRGSVAKEIEVVSMTIGNLIEVCELKDICLIKIDVEGGEEKIMNRETSAMLAKAGNPPILLAVHPAWMNDFNLFMQNLLLWFPQYNFDLIAKDTYLCTSVSA